MVKQFDLISRFSINNFPLDEMAGCTYRSPAGDRKLNIKNDYSRAKRDRKRDKVVRRTKDIANVNMDRIDRRQVESCVGSRSGPRHVSFVEIDC